MSTFPGIIDEIDGISIDNFEGDENLNASFYFLSHCHSDHTRGLKDMLCSIQFSMKNDVFIYASPITVTILGNMYPSSRNKFISKQIGYPHCFENPKTGKNFFVTLIPAGHCPGSVMFLFETEKTILYTGDIRLTVKELKESKALKYTSHNLKKIDKLYLDTTFFMKSYENFPNRLESVEAFIHQTKSWLENSENYVYYELPARYGNEYLMIEASKILKMPFLVFENNYETYKCIPEMDKRITLNPSESRIFACHSNDYTKVCHKLNNVDPNNIMTIKTSIQRWKNNDYKKGIIERNGKNKFYIAYSSHCSYNELIDIIYFLKPDDIYPNCLPSNKVEENEMYNLIDSVLKDVHKTDKEIVKKKNIGDFNWRLPDKSDSKKDDDHTDNFLNNIPKKLKTSP